MALKSSSPIFATLMAFGMISFAPVCLADLSFGAGWGPEFAGVGGKMIHTADKWETSLGLGCSSYNTENGSSCGPSLSITNFNLLSNDERRHGISIVIGKLDDEIRVSQSQSSYLKRVYGYGVGYKYHFGDKSTSGLHTGIFLNRRNNSDRGTYLTWQIGYHF